MDRGVRCGRALQGGEYLCSYSAPMYTDEEVELAAVGCHPCWPLHFTSHIASFISSWFHSLEFWVLGSTAERVPFKGVKNFCHGEHFKIFWRRTENAFVDVQTNDSNKDDTYLFELNVFATVVNEVRIMHSSCHCVLAPCALQVRIARTAVGG